MLLWACCWICVPSDPAASPMVCKRRWMRAACQQTQPRDSHGPFSRKVVKTTKDTSPSAQLLDIKANVCVFSGYINLLYLTGKKRLAFFCSKYVRWLSCSVFSNSFILYRQNVCIADVVPKNRWSRATFGEFSEEKNQKPLSHTGC